MRGTHIKSQPPTDTTDLPAGAVKPLGEGGEHRGVAHARCPVLILPVGGTAQVRAEGPGSGGLERPLPGLLPYPRQRAAMGPACPAADDGVTPAGLAVPAGRPAAPGLTDAGHSRMVPGGTVP